MWNGLLVFAPLVADRSAKKVSPSWVLSKNADRRLFLVPLASDAANFPAVPLISSLDNSSVASASWPEIPRYVISSFRGFSAVKVSMTLQSVFSDSRDASTILVSQILVRLCSLIAVSKASVIPPISVSIAKFEIRMVECLGEVPSDSGVEKLITFPPNPNEAPAGLSNHLGALGKEKDAVWGCDCALLKKSSPSNA